MRFIHRMISEVNIDYAPKPIERSNNRSYTIDEYIELIEELLRNVTIEKSKGIHIMRTIKEEIMVIHVDIENYDVNTAMKIY